MPDIKPYKKEKEGHLQRLPVKHIDGYQVDMSVSPFNWIEKGPIPKTNVIVHHGKLDQKPLEMIKQATMATNPFIALMRRIVKAIEERENAAKND